jgi:hypothetical protein
MDRILKPRVSRRTFLRAGVAVGSGAIIIGSGSPSEAEAAKVAKATVNYQMNPKGQAHCATCTYFQAPSSCKFVDGPIIPTGWCTLYKAK